MRKPKKPSRICGDCLHVSACMAWNNGRLYDADATHCVNFQPAAADVRPVVMCGECKYWELSKIEPSFNVCTYVCGATFVRKAEDFCSRGEKKEES